MRCTQELCSAGEAFCSLNCDVFPGGFSHCGRTKPYQFHQVLAMDLAVSGNK